VTSFPKDLGLLIIRLGVGLPMVYRGYLKLAAGPGRWRGIGAAMENLGISFAPTFWGFMAAFAEGVGGLCIVLGFQVQIAAALLCFTMLIAFLRHYMAGDGFGRFIHPVELGAVFLGLALIGPGRFALRLRIPLGKHRIG